MYTTSPPGQAGTASPVPKPPLVPPRGPAGPTVKPALIFVSILLAIVVVGMVAMALTGSSGRAPANPVVHTAKGSPLRAVPARPDLHPIISGGLPPGDVLDAIVLPKGARSQGIVKAGEGVGSYSQAMVFTSTASESDLIAFYKIELPALGWKVLQAGPPHGSPGYEVLAQRPGSDGNYWELGALISPTSFSSTTTGSSPDSATGITRFTLRLFIVSGE